MPVSSSSAVPCRAGLFLALSLLAGGAALAACSSSSTKATAHGDGGQGDGAVEADADEDASLDAGTGPDDVTIYPEAPSMMAPDGCLLLGANCLDQSMCCSAYCVEGGCSEMPKPM